MKYRVGHFSFFQVNRFLVEELAREVTEVDVAENEAAGARSFSPGVGLFSVPLAKRFERVVAVESNPAAARDLETNIARADRSKCARRTWKHVPAEVSRKSPTLSCSIRRARA